MSATSHCWGYNTVHLSPQVKVANFRAEAARDEALLQAVDGAAEGRFVLVISPCPAVRARSSGCPCASSLDDKPHGRIASL